MTYYGYITKDARVIIIGADKQEVEDTYKAKGFGESHIEQKQIAKFTCSTDSSMITLTGFETNTARTKAIQEELTALKTKENKTVVRTYPDIINSVLTR